MQAAVRSAGAAHADRFGSRFDRRDQHDFLQYVVAPLLIVLKCGRGPCIRITSRRIPIWCFPMLLTGMKEIDLLETGLPVSQYQDETLRAELESRFTGEHRISPRRTVDVKKSAGGGTAYWGLARLRE